MPTMDSADSATWPGIFVIRMVVLCLIFLLTASGRRLAWWRPCQATPTAEVQRGRVQSALLVETDALVCLAAADDPPTAEVAAGPKGFRMPMLATPMLLFVVLKAPMLPLPLLKKPTFATP